MSLDNTGNIIMMAFMILIGGALLVAVSDQVVGVSTLTPNTDTLNIAGARLYTWAGNVTVVNETLTAVDNATGKNLAYSGYAQVICSILGVTNASSGTVIPATNYTQTNCNIKAKPGDPDFTDLDWNVTYKYNYMNNLGAINESYTFELSNAVLNGSIASYPECRVSTITLKNQSSATMTVSTHYLFTSGTALLTLKNHASWNKSSSNSSTAFYGYCADDYVGGASKTIIGLSDLFFVLIILAGVIYLMFPYLREIGAD